MKPEFIKTNFTGPKRLRGKMEWAFTPRKRSGKRFYYRIAFDPTKRVFVAKIFDWSDRRKPKLAVRELSPEFCAVLRESLPAAAIAECTAASIKRAGAE